MMTVAARFFADTAMASRLILGSSFLSPAHSLLQASGLRIGGAASFVTPANEFDDRLWFKARIFHKLNRTGEVQILGQREMREESGRASHARRQRWLDRLPSSSTVLLNYIYNVLIDLVTSLIGLMV